MKPSSSMLILGIGAKPKGGDAKGKGPVLMGEKSKVGDKPADDMKESRVSAMKSLISAVKANDPESADEALSIHYELCSSGTPAEGVEDDEY